MKKSLSQLVRLLVFGCLTAASVTLVHAQQTGFTESFDDPAMPGWEIKNAGVGDGVLHIEPGGFGFRPGKWSDFTLTIRTRYNGDGAAVIAYRSTDADEYSLQLGKDVLSLSRAGLELGKYVHTIPPGEWALIEITVKGGAHTITVNNHPAITASDANPLTAGGVMLRAAGGTASEFDDLSLTESSAPQPALSNPEPTLTTSLPAYQAGSWVRLGGPPGGTGYDIRMRTDNPDIMFVTDASGGIFKSTDRGMSWSALNQGIEAFPGAGAPIFSATIDPHDYDVVWVGTQLTGHLYRSGDNGQTWEQRDHGILTTGEDMRSLRGITVDPGNPDVLYLGVEVTLRKKSPEIQPGWRAETAGEVYKSIDGAMHWTRVWYGPNLARYVWVDPRNSDRVYVSTGIFDRTAANASDPAAGEWGGVGILRSDDGGQTWTELNEKNGLNGLYIPSLFMHPTDPDLMLAAASGAGGRSKEPGVYVTRDGGDTWERILPIDAPLGMDAVEIAISDPDIWYAASENTIYRSDDAGRNWQPFDMFTADRKAGMPIDLQVDPRDPYRIFVNNYGGGNMVSTDGGQTWADASLGYTGAHVGGLGISPSDAWQVTAGANTGTFHSVDGGMTWSGAIYSRIESLVTLPAQPGNAGTTLLAGTNTAQLYRSPDGGATWSEPTFIAQKDNLWAVRALAVARSDSQRLYAGLAYFQCIRGDFRDCSKNGGEFYRSNDGGVSWQEVTGIPFGDVAVLGIAINPQDANRVYVATGKGLYVTQDGGGTWKGLDSLHSAALQAPKPDSDLYPSSLVVFDILIDPFNSNTLYAGTAQAGVLLSSDGGATWGLASAGMDPNEPIYDIEPDLNHQGILYASSWFSGVFFTTDGGQTWQKLNNGLPPIAMRNLALSPDGSVLYAATLAAGVWRLGTPAGEPTPAPTGFPPAGAASPTPESTAKPGICGSAAMLSLVMIGLTWLRRRK